MPKMYRLNSNTYINLDALCVAARQPDGQLAICFPGIPPMMLSIVDAPDFLRMLSRWLVVGTQCPRCDMAITDNPGVKGNWECSCADEPAPAPASDPAPAALPSTGLPSCSRCGKTIFDGADSPRWACRCDN